MLPDLSLSLPVHRSPPGAPTLRLVTPPAAPETPHDAQQSRPRYPRDVARICAAVSMRRRVRRGELLIHAGQRFKSLAWVGSGLLMSRAGSGNAVRTTGFHLPGEIVGLDGIANDEYPFDVCALEDGVVRQAPFALVEQLASAEPPLLQALHRAMSRELLRSGQLAMVLAATSAEARLAAFLVDFWQRSHGNWAQQDDVVLSMGRADIGSYLGLTMESISRGFARLARRGFIDVRRRRLRMIDIDGLQAFVAEHL